VELTKGPALASLGGLLLSVLVLIWLFASPTIPQPPGLQQNVTAAKTAPPVFVPPSLEALKTVKWSPQRVVSGFDVLREIQAPRPAPLPEDEALRLRNTDPQSNARIAAAVGRLPRSDEEVDWDATYFRYLPSDVRTFNYIFYSSRYEGEVLPLVYAGLFGFDSNLVPLAGAETVSEWSTSEDRMMDRVVLRDDITWSDGKPFTAHDVEFSFRTIMSPDVRCPAVKNGADKLKMVKAYDARTVVYFHKEPLVTNVFNLNFPIMPKHVYEPTLARDPTMQASEEHIRLSENPVTSGQYRLVSWKKGQEIIFERRPEWYERHGKRIRPKPHFKRIHFRIIADRAAAFLAFRSGEIDEYELTPDHWALQTNGDDFHARATKVWGTEWSLYWIGWNQRPIPDAPYFKDRRVREAMAIAFPYSEFIEKITYALYQPATGIFHTDSWMADPALQPFRQDLPRAAKLLAEAGWADTDGDNILDRMENGQKVPFRFSFLIPAGNPLYGNIASLQKRDLEKLGVVCEVKEMDFTTVQALAREHRFHAICFGFGTGADPDTVRNILGTKAYEEGRNFTGYSNPKVDDLLEKGQKEFDPARRAAIYREVDRIVATDLPFSFVCFRPTLAALSKDVRGYNFSPRGPYGFTPGVGAVWKKKS